VEPVGGLSLKAANDVAVGVERDRDRRVAEPFLHYLRMHTFREKKRSSSWTWTVPRSHVASATRPSWTEPSIHSPCCSGLHPMHRAPDSREVGGTDRPRGFVTRRV